MAWSLQAGAGAIYSSGTTGVIPLPASVIAGDLLLLFVDNTSVSGSPSSSGWTQIFNQQLGNDDFFLFRKTAGGSETDPTVTWSIEQIWAAMIVRVRGHGGNPAQITGQASLTTTASIDPPDAGSVKIAAVTSDPTITGGTVTWSGGASGLGSIGHSDRAFVAVGYKEEDTAGAITFTTTLTPAAGTVIMSVTPAAAGGAFAPRIIGTY